MGLCGSEMVGRASSDRLGKEIGDDRAVWMYISLLSFRDMLISQGCVEVLGERYVGSLVCERVMICGEHA
jgi:hypothetical protein